MYALKALLFALIPAAQAFSGLGQIRTLYIGRDHDDLGCLTSQGKWTTDEALCGTFYAYRLSTNAKGMSTFRLAGVDVGICGIAPAGVFKCGGVKDVDFGTWGNEGPVKHRDVLRYGQYGVVASYGNNPPAPEEGPLQVHFYSGAEKGKYVWLVWKSLEEGADA
ncbi:hypothetical protein QBC38DRAFT_25008 [Podospora fimiseda]|uniref:Ecp2 effector protein domain-containing protein n=1 Tax=Podospora fimiseda TaxID=252190 RepID=A0AAN7BJ73_9PEZI|nr:hypothetical protein QBC38DRAFT_25008 [Podospora fimiseda]